MENTKENVIKVLEKMIATKREYAKSISEKEDKEFEEVYNKYMNEVFILERAYKLLTNKEYFNEIAEIWLDEEEGNDNG